MVNDCFGTSVRALPLTGEVVVTFQMSLLESKRCLICVARDGEEMKKLTCHSVTFDIFNAIPAPSERKWDGHTVPWTPWKHFEIRSLKEDLIYFTWRHCRHDVALLGLFGSTAAKLILLSLPFFLDLRLEDGIRT